MLTFLSVTTMRSPLLRPKVRFFSYVLKSEDFTLIHTYDIYIQHDYNRYLISSSVTQRFALRLADFYFSVSNFEKEGTFPMNGAFGQSKFCSDKLIFKLKISF